MPRRVLLVIDDDPVTLNQISWGLRDEYEVVPAGDPERARQIVGERPVDLVLLDLHLPPDTSIPRYGLDFLSWVRATRCPPPVVVMSSHGGPEVELRCRTGGADGFVEKPVACDTLRRALERAWREATSSEAGSGCGA